MNSGDNYVISPHNPTSSVISVDDLHKFEDIVKHMNLYVISDDIYEHIIFDGMKHVSISESEALSKKAFVISSKGRRHDIFHLIV
jgi:methionine transaminase